jgi:hypothetical protein
VKKERRRKEGKKERRKLFENISVFQLQV